MEELKQFTQELFEKAGFPPKEVTVREDGAAIRVDVFVDRAGMIIGQGGEILPFWEEVMQKHLSLITDQKKRVIVDINNYRFQHEERLKEIAHQAAKKAIMTKKPVKLLPMSSYERRVIHAELALRPDVNTESEGEAPNRCVVIKPI
jgi:spoIIIJ-associated protein